MKEQSFYSIIYPIVIIIYWTLIVIIQYLKLYARSYKKCTLVLHPNHTLQTVIISFNTWDCPLTSHIRVFTMDKILHSRSKTVVANKLHPSMNHFAIRALHRKHSAISSMFQRTTHLRRCLTIHVSDSTARGRFFLWRCAHESRSAPLVLQLFCNPRFRIEPPQSTGLQQYWVMLPALVPTLLSCCICSWYRRPRIIPTTSCWCVKHAAFSQLREVQKSGKLRSIKCWATPAPDDRP